MPVVIGVKFERECRLNHFEPAGLELAAGDSVVAESVRGPEIGVVEEEAREVPDAYLAHPLRMLLRRATESDLQRAEQNRRKEASAWTLALERIAHHNLEMKVVDVHYALDGSKMTLFFTADGRVDFRELVKDLASSLRSRVHLLQIGARDAARFHGGLGVCGRELCCVAWLQSFDAISMKMAKDQSLFLNPSKFSGRCGKLMCCLRYEHDTYLDAKDSLPVMGSSFTTPKGVGRVVEVNVLRQEALVDVPDVGRLSVPFGCPSGCPNGTGVEGQGCPGACHEDPVSPPEE